MALIGTIHYGTFNARLFSLLISSPSGILSTNEDQELVVTFPTVACLYVHRIAMRSESVLVDMNRYMVMCSKPC